MLTEEGLLPVSPKITYMFPNQIIIELNNQPYA